MKDEHIRLAWQDEDEDIGEGHREISWIWMVKGDAVDEAAPRDDELNECEFFPLYLLLFFSSHIWVYLWNGLSLKPVPHDGRKKSSC